MASLVAVVIVTSMVLWMRKASGSLSGELRTGMSQALETGPLAVTALAFLAVGREGVETALFMVGYAEAETTWPLAGLLLASSWPPSPTACTSARSGSTCTSSSSTQASSSSSSPPGFCPTASERCRPSAGYPDWAPRRSTSPPGSTGRPGTAR